MAKGIMYINNQRAYFDGEKNVLAVIRKAGIHMPTLCYYSDLSVYGACRMCVVEDDKGRIDASCSMEPRDGMVIYTNTNRLLRYRRMIIELLLASHDRECTLCEKSGSCQLQELALRFGVRRVRFKDTRPQLPLDDSSPAVVRNPNKCILCGDCVRICEEIQGMNIIDFTHRSANLRVMPAFDQKLADTDCIGCGQCAAVCPTGRYHHLQRHRQGLAGSAQQAEAGGLPGGAGGAGSHRRGLRPAHRHEQHGQDRGSPAPHGRLGGVRYLLCR